MREIDWGNFTASVNHGSGELIDNHPGSWTWMGETPAKMVILAHFSPLIDGKVPDSGMIHQIIWEGVVFPGQTIDLDYKPRMLGIVGMPD